jgi:hypothetical protein
VRREHRAPIPTRERGGKFKRGKGMVSPDEVKRTEKRRYRVREVTGGEKTNGRERVTIFNEVREISLDFP